MSDLPDELPSDPAELRVFAAALLDRCARLERLLKLAKDAQFGRSSEKLDADQLQLVLEDIDQAVANVTCESIGLIHGFGFSTADPIDVNFRCILDQSHA